MNADLLYIAADNQVTVYADGIELLTHSSFTEDVGVEIPCGTDLVALEVHNDGSNEYGLKASFLKDSWSTGEGILVCSSNATIETLDWKVKGLLISFDISFFYIFSIIFVKTQWLDYFQLITRLRLIQNENEIVLTMYQS